MVYKLIKVCLVLSICPSWEHMNPNIEPRPISALNTFPLRLHEVVGPWLSNERGAKERGPLKRCFVLV